MTVFLFALAGIPPLAGWFAKFEIFRATANAGTGAGYVLAVVRRHQLGDRALLLRAGRAGDVDATGRPTVTARRIRVPPALAGALAICVVAVVVIGVYPQLVARLGDMATFAFA